MWICWMWTCRLVWDKGITRLPMEVIFREDKYDNDGVFLQFHWRKILNNVKLTQVIKKNRWLNE